MQGQVTLGLLPILLTLDSHIFLHLLIDIKFGNSVRMIGLTSVSVCLFMFLQILSAQLKNLIDIIDIFPLQDYFLQKDSFDKKNSNYPGKFCN